MAHEEHAAHAPTAGAYFTPEEIQRFWAEDKQMATFIVCLLSGVFATGLCLYLGVCYWVTH